MPAPRSTVVIGAGVVGAFTALELARAGVEVTLVDKNTLGNACSHANCGYVCPSHSLPLAAPGVLLPTMLSMFKPDSPFYIKPRLSWRLCQFLTHFALRCNQATMERTAHALHPMLVSSRRLHEQHISDMNLDCDWAPDGCWFVYQSRQGFEHFKHEAELLNRLFGQQFLCASGDDLLNHEPALKPGAAHGGWFYQDDATVRPDKLMAQLGRVLQALGVKLVTGTEVLGFVREGQRMQAVRTSNGDIAADSFVLATGAWAPFLEKELGLKIHIQPGKGYSITMPRPAICPKVPMIFMEHRVACTPFRSGYRLGSTMEFAGYDTSINERRVHALVKGAAVYLREPTCEPVQETWFGWRPMTWDSLPLIGAVPAATNCFINAGHNMLGLTLGPVSGRLLREMMLGQAPHLDPRPYAPHRFQ